jgi:hypothetical protein
MRRPFTRKTECRASAHHSRGRHSAPVHYALWLTPLTYTDCNVGVYHCAVRTQAIGPLDAVELVPQYRDNEGLDWSTLTTGILHAVFHVAISKIDGRC